MYAHDFDDIFFLQACLRINIFKTGVIAPRHFYDLVM